MKVNMMKVVTEYTCEVKADPTLGQLLGGDRMTALRAKWLDYQPSTGWQRLYRAAAIRIIDAIAAEYAAPGATIAHRIRTVGNMLADRAESAGSVRAAEAYHFAVGLLERDADGETPV